MGYKVIEEAVYSRKLWFTIGSFRMKRENKIPARKRPSVGTKFIWQTHWPYRVWVDLFWLLRSCVEDYSTEKQPRSRKNHIDYLARKRERRHIWTSRVWRYRTVSVRQFQNLQINADKSMTSFLPSFIILIIIIIIIIIHRYRVFFTIIWADKLRWY